MKRRTLLGGVGVAGLASLAGCLGVIGMDEHESSPAGVDASVRGDTGYEQTGIDDIVVEEEIGIGGVSESIAVTNYLTEHEKSVDMGPLGSQRGAVFMVLTTPQIGALGQNVNPVEDMSADELVELVEDNYDDISNISREEDEEITILDETTTRSRFSADATFDGQDLEVDLHVSEAIETSDDLLVTIGVYPQRVRAQEEDNIIALMEGVSTDVDHDDTDGGGEDDGSSDGGDDDETDDGSDGEDGENDDDTDGGDDGGVLDALE